MRESKVGNKWKCLVKIKEMVMIGMVFCFFVIKLRIRLLMIYYYVVDFEGCL